MSKRKKEKKLIRKMNALPILLVIIFVVAHVLWIQGIQKFQTVNYIVQGKVHEGYVQATRVMDIYNAMTQFDGAALDEFYQNASALSGDNFLGIIVIQNDTVIYEKGCPFPENTFQRERSNRDFANFTDSNLPVYFDMDGNNELYLGLKTNFNMAFSSRPLRENNPFANNGFINPQLNEQGWQDIWYEFSIDESTKAICGFTIALTDYEYQLSFLTNFAAIVICFLTILAVLIIIIRVIKSQTKLVNAYYMDRVTGGKNWYYFLYHASIQMRRTAHKDSSCAIIQIRMLKYENYCACYGEEEGEKLLSEIYAVMVKCMPQNTLYVRSENADFAILYSFEDKDTMTKIVNYGIETLKKLRPDSSIAFKAGVYVVEAGENVDLSEAYNRAAIAREKSEGIFAEDVVFFNSKMKDDIYWEKKMENDLERGITNEEFKVYLQPKYSVASEKMVAAEALIRWEHPEEGFLSPFKFIPIYEKNGMILKIDDYMISHLAKLQAEYISAGIDPLPISVNLSRIHFTNINLAEHISELVDAYQVPHKYIELELTESAFFDDKEVIIETANRLRAMGFAVSLDDFGSGFSSLNSLRDLPIDILKLDAGFFRGGDMDEKTSVIIRGIIQLAKQLNIKIVAEGIEHIEQVDFLRENECDMIQGYYFAKPMPIEDFNNKMKTDKQIE